MKMLNIPQLFNDIALLPEITDVENSSHIEKCLNLLDLLSDDYITPEHLLVPKESWVELGSFIASLQNYNEPLNPYFETIRTKIANVVIVKKLEQGLMQIRALPVMSEDFI